MIRSYTVIKMRTEYLKDITISQLIQTMFTTINLLTYISIQIMTSAHKFSAVQNLIEEVMVFRVFEEFSFPMNSSCCISIKCNPNEQNTLLLDQSNQKKKSI